MSIYEKYFDKNFDDIVKSDCKKIDNLLKNNMLLISGDFYGIQKFIFERLSTKNASKVLRAKSAYIQIFTEYISKYVCNKLNISQECILTVNAGKFEIVSENNDLKVLEKIQNEIDNFFIENFFGLSGFNICSVSCSSDDFKAEDKYALLREKIANKIEISKFSKFNLLNLESPILNYDSNINNQTLCKVCNIRKIKNKSCPTCEMFKKLGELLAGDSIEILKNSEYFGLHFDSFTCDIKIDKKIKSYMLIKDNSPVDFTTLANNSCKNLETGIKSIAVLKADVDSMGKYLKDSDITKNFDNFDTFSKTLDNFFSLYIPKLMKEKYPNTYTIFAGGDDLFLVGAWNEVLELAREIHKEFKVFIKNKLTISFGISIIKPSYPISRIAEYTEELLEKSKNLNSDKNAITIFNETVSWESYLKVFESLTKTFNKIDDKDLNTAFLYRLLDLLEMSKNVKFRGIIEDTMWKSKLAYSFTRNMDKKYVEILDSLNINIENNPSETKMFLNEFIYKRRD